MEHLFRELFRYADRLTMQHWAVVMGCMILVAIYCMRGFGSRKDY